MKAKYIILSVFALVATVACKKEGATLLSEFHADKTYVAIPETDGTFSVKVSATEDWTFDFDIPKDTTVLDAQKKTKKKTLQVNQLVEYPWVSISPASGKAGETTITFKDNRAAYFKQINGKDPKEDDDLGSFTQTFKVKVGKDVYQNFVVSVGKPASAVVVTVKQLAGEDSDFTPVDGKRYQITGSCVRIANTNYGNWYLKDDSSDKQLYIYGTVDATGSYNWSSFGIEVGDKVTVEGPYTLYGTTIEFVDASVVKVEKALLQAVGSSTKYVGKESKPLEIELVQKGTGLGYESLTDWLVLDKTYSTNKEGNLVFTVTPEENTTGASRTGTLAFYPGKDETPINITIVQQADFTKGTLKDIRDLCAAKKPFDVELTKPVTVTFVSGNYMFVEDGEVGLTVYKSADKYSAGQVISGRVFAGKGSVYNDVPQATGFNCALGKAAAAPVDPAKLPQGTECTLQQVVDNWDTWAYRLVTIKGLSVTDEIKATYPTSTGDDERHPKYDDKGKEITEKGDLYGEVSDGTNKMAIGINTDAFYLNMEVGKKYDVTCIPFMMKIDNVVVKALSLWKADQVKEVE